MSGPGLLSVGWRRKTSLQRCWHHSISCRQNGAVSQNRQQFGSEKPQPSVCRRCSQGRHRRLLLVARPESGMKVVCWRLGSKHRVFETCWGSSAFNVGQMPTSSPTRLTAVDPSILPDKPNFLPTPSWTADGRKKRRVRHFYATDRKIWKALHHSTNQRVPRRVSKLLFWVCCPGYIIFPLIPVIMERQMPDYSCSSHSCIFSPLRKMTFQAPINDDYYIRRWKVPVQVWGTAMTASWPAGSQLKTNSEPIGDPDWMIHQHGKHLQKNSKYTFM